MRGTGPDRDGPTGPCRTVPSTENSSSDRNRLFKSHAPKLHQRLGATTGWGRNTVNTLNVFHFIGTLWSLPLSSTVDSLCRWSRRRHSRTSQTEPFGTLETHVTRFRHVSRQPVVYVASRISAYVGPESSRLGRRSGSGS